MPIKNALWVALIISAIVLFFVGIYKAKLTVGKPLKSGIQMAIIGMTAALAGYAIGKLFGAN
jgi:VIT1/CCC1 family predicted Fe2+/Mn2+ transporter